jgi:hypothetical protein
MEESKVEGQGSKVKTGFSFDLQPSTFNQLRMGAAYVLAMESC